MASGLGMVQTYFDLMELSLMQQNVFKWAWGKIWRPVRGSVRALLPDAFVPAWDVAVGFTGLTATQLGNLWGVSPWLCVFVVCFCLLFLRVARRKYNESTFMEKLRTVNLWLLYVGEIYWWIGEVVIHLLSYVFMYLVYDSLCAYLPWAVVAPLVCVSVVVNTGMLVAKVFEPKGKKIVIPLNPLHCKWVVGTDGSKHVNIDGEMIIVEVKEFVSEGAPVNGESARVVWKPREMAMGPECLAKGKYLSGGAKMKKSNFYIGLRGKSATGTPMPENLTGLWFCEDMKKGQGIFTTYHSILELLRHPASELVVSHDLQTWISYPSVFSKSVQDWKVVNATGSFNMEKDKCTAADAVYCLNSGFSAARLGVQMRKHFKNYKIPTVVTVFHARRSLPIGINQGTVCATKEEVDDCGLLYSNYNSDCGTSGSIVDSGSTPETEAVAGMHLGCSTAKLGFPNVFVGLNVLNMCMARAHGIEGDPMAHVMSNPTVELIARLCASFIAVDGITGESGGGNSKTRTDFQKLMRSSRFKRKGKKYVAMLLYDIKAGSYNPYFTGLDEDRKRARDMLDDIEYMDVHDEDTHVVFEDEVKAAAHAARVYKKTAAIADRGRGDYSERTRETKHQSGALPDLYARSVWNVLAGGPVLVQPLDGVDLGPYEYCPFVEEELPEEIRPRAVLPQTVDGVTYDFVMEPKADPNVECVQVEVTPREENKAKEPEAPQVEVVPCEEETPAVEPLVVEEQPLEPVAEDPVAEEAEEHPAVEQELTAADEEVASETEAVQVEEVIEEQKVPEVDKAFEDLPSLEQIAEWRAVHKKYPMMVKPPYTNKDYVDPRSPVAESAAPVDPPGLPALEKKTELEILKEKLCNKMYHVRVHQSLWKEPKNVFIDTLLKSYSTEVVYEIPSAHPSEEGIVHLLTETIAEISNPGESVLVVGDSTTCSGIRSSRKEVAEAVEAWLRRPVYIASVSGASFSDRSNSFVNQIEEIIEGCYFYDKVLLVGGWNESVPKPRHIENFFRAVPLVLETSKSYDFGEDEELAADPIQVEPALKPLSVAKCPPPVREPPAPPVVSVAVSPVLGKGKPGAVKDPPTGHGVGVTLPLPKVFGPSDSEAKKSEKEAKSTLIREKLKREEAKVSAKEAKRAPQGTTVEKVAPVVTPQCVNAAPGVKTWFETLMMFCEGSAEAVSEMVGVFLPPPRPSINVKPKATRPENVGPTKLPAYHDDIPESNLDAEGNVISYAGNLEESQKALDELDNFVREELMQPGKLKTLKVSEFFSRLGEIRSKHAISHKVSSELMRKLFPRNCGKMPKEQGKVEPKVDHCTYVGTCHELQGDKEDVPVTPEVLAEQMLKCKEFGLINEDGTMQYHSAKRSVKAMKASLRQQLGAKLPRTRGYTPEHLEAFIAGQPSQPYDEDPSVADYMAGLVKQVDNSKTTAFSKVYNRQPLKLGYWNDLNCFESTLRVLYTVALTTLCTNEFVENSSAIDKFEMCLIEPEVCFVKDEMHPLKKVKEERWRLIWNASAHAEVVTRFFHDFQNKLNIMLFQDGWTHSEACPTFGACPGMGHHDEGHQQVCDAMRRMGVKSKADAKGWDFSVTHALWKCDGFVRARLAEAGGWPPLMCDAILRFASCCADHIIVLGKNLFMVNRKGIMGSGSVSTSATNSTMRAVIHSECRWADCGVVSLCLTMGDDIACKDVITEAQITRSKELGMMLSDYEEVKDDVVDFTSHLYDLKTGCVIFNNVKKLIARICMLPQLVTQEQVVGMLFAVRNNCGDDLSLVRRALDAAGGALFKGLEDRCLTCMDTKCVL